MTRTVLCMMASRSRVPPTVPSRLLPRRPARRSHLSALYAGWAQPGMTVSAEAPRAIPTYTTRTVTCQPSRACRPRARYPLFTVSAAISGKWS